MAAEAAVSFAVETLGNLLIEKAVFLKSVKGEVEWVRDELKSMQCFLKDAAKQQSDNHSIRNWISDVRKVAHDAEDAIEMFVLKVQTKSKLKKRYIPNHLYHLNKVGNKIKSIRQTLKDIQDRRVNYDIQKDEREEASTRTKTQEEIETRRRLAYWKPNDQQVVGLEEDVKQLLGKAVFEKSKGLSLAAILGMGGMGKSTLASKIYNHTQVVDRFDFRSWVVVSSEFNPEDVMKQLLKQLGGISVDELTLLGSIDDKVGRQEQLKKELHQRLAGKRYFIVLDDVWEPEHWESLSTAFPADGDKGGRLLLTSRNQAIITMNTGYVHNMKPLDVNHSWNLFMTKAFGGNSSIDGCPEELKEVGEEILKKCGGLPLAIGVVGGLLAKKTRSKSQWEKVLKEMNSHLDRSSGDLNTITSILELSYQNLPLELKACFLCLGFFKEDSIIKAKKLAHIWVAHGLVVQEVESEEVARDYLNELISRNMVQVMEMKYDEVKACQMHDLLRDLSIRKAREEINFEVVREEWNSSHQSLDNPRHRAIYWSSEPNFIFSTNRNQHLRSLFIHQEHWQFIIGGGPSSFWKKFELLRVLEFGSTVFKVLPEGIGELTGLRYLKIRCKYGEDALMLPRSWAKLENLEVLDLRGNGAGIIIDKVILKMESLRHLYVDVSSSKVDLGNMKNLQTLHMFQMNSSDVWKIQRMSRVSKLGITVYDIEETSSSLFTCLSSLENLFHLTLSVNKQSIDLKGLTSLNRVTRLKLRFITSLIDVAFPPNLSHLTLSRMLLDEGLMAVLEKLPNLLYLKLKLSNTRDRIMVITSGGFPTLKVLCLQNIGGLCKMEIEESGMPELNQFIIRKCPYLDVENLPDRIKSAIVQPH